MSYKSALIGAVLASTVASEDRLNILPKQSM